VWGAKIFFASLSSPCHFQGGFAHDLKRACDPGFALLFHFKTYYSIFLYLFPIISLSPTSHEQAFLVVASPFYNNHTSNPRLRHLAFSPALRFLVRL
jgi:hypothetical protein